MLCEQVLGKLHDFDITGKTIEYVDIEWHEAFKKIHKKNNRQRNRSGNPHGRFHSRQRSVSG